MLRPCDFLVLGDISTFGLNRESMTRNIPFVLGLTRNANTTLSTINAIQLACLYSFLQPNDEFHLLFSESRERSERIGEKVRIKTFFGRYSSLSRSFIIMK
ncbi:MAG: hypothetical protein MUP85_24335 [Candidatus Lokiarchaeota archaeon]|nr:hypothetical protein [Candidatus Lokiarchaeota archaeon]